MTSSWLEEIDFMSKTKWVENATLKQPKQMYIIYM